MYSDWATVTPGCLFNSIPFEGGWGGGGGGGEKEGGGGGGGGTKVETGGGEGGLSNLEQLSVKTYNTKWKSSSTKRFEVMQPGIRIKSELQVRKETIPDQSTRRLINQSFQY